MRLDLRVPSGRLVEVEVSEVVAEGTEGSFGVLPRHRDIVSVLVPGILLYETGEGEEGLAAVDRGLLVKCGPEVRVSVRDAVPGDDLAGLRRTVRERFETLEDRERLSRSALARLEAQFLRRFVEQMDRGRS